MPPIMKGGEYKMKKNKRQTNFHCPDCVPANAPDDFCIPEECCPDQIDQPKIPSPNSCLPLDELDKLRARARETNQLLLDLALSHQREPREIFQRAFDGLVGLNIKVEIDCPLVDIPEKNIDRTGKVSLVGFDFVVLRKRNRNKSEVIIPFDRIIKIKSEKGRFAEPSHEPELIDIEPCLRRALTFNFGEKVASSPELIQIFFRLRLNIYLLLLVGKKVKVSLAGKNIEGTIVEVNKESITLKMKKRIKEIPINNVCFITVKK